MGKIICVCNQKGGVGKTTTVISLAAYLASMGRKTLLIDIDPQGNATSGIGVDKGALAKSIYDVIIGAVELADVVVGTGVESLYLAPSNMALTGAEIELVGAERREYHLKDALQGVREAYEFILIDTPPSLGLLTINALTAADSILIPLQCEYYSLEGVSQLMNTVELIRSGLNPSLEIEGVLMTMADFRTNLANQVIDEVKGHFKDKVYKTVIPRTVRLSEAPGFGKPISVYDKHSIGARRYEDLAKEFLGIPLEVESVNAAIDTTAHCLDVPPVIDEKEGDFNAEEGIGQGA
ncbi:MAG: hypothetical protein AUJ75_01185 [Candidatus Omnitrophica bacterium CG1_02_49_10]|nr:MAG: hypothetical protein AUJ75_01185 [Candidatus Omnitrophica bacterium CG1_02_49_10]